ncbi:MAG TPA: response regulator transcription factor [Brumimicrobium sp.]|nr:response regulator transcription factor [Brumimicrobium sp.]
MTESKFDILIVDDHKMLLEGIRSFIANQFPLSNVLLASTHNEILSILEKRKIDVLLLDLLLGDEDSRTFIFQLQELQPKMKIVVVSSLEEEMVVNVLIQGGVNGFVGKSSSTIYIAEAINAVLTGETYIDPLLKENFQERNKHLKSEQIVLTRREKEVLNETLKGKKIKEIADALFISVKTVENHRSNLFVKFEVSNVSGLIKKALLLSYLPDTD